MNQTSGNIHQMANNNMAMVPITSPAYRPMGTSNVLPTLPTIPTFPLLSMPQYVFGSTPGYAMTASGIPYGINVPAGTIVPAKSLPSSINTGYQHPGFVNSEPKEVAPGMVLINGQLYRKMPKTPPVVPARPNEIREHEHNTNHDCDDHNNCKSDNLLDICYEDLEDMFQRMNTEAKMAENTVTFQTRPKQVRFMDEAMGHQTFDKTWTNRRMKHERLSRNEQYNPQTTPTHTSNTVNKDVGTTNSSKHNGHKGKTPLKRTSQFYA